MKISTNMKALACWVLGLMLAACGTMSDPGDTAYHACDSGEKDWSGVPNLELEHLQPETCPISAETDDEVEVGGTVVETSAPGFPQNGTASGLTVDVWENYSTSVYLGSGNIVSAYDSFGYANGTSGDWQAQAFPFYEFSINPDYLEFTVTCFSSCGGFPTAWVAIDNGGPE